MAARKTASPVVDAPAYTLTDAFAELGALSVLADVARALGNMDGKTFRTGVRSLGVHVSRGGVWDAATCAALYDARPSIARRIDAYVESRNA